VRVDCDGASAGADDGKVCGRNEDEDVDGVVAVIAKESVLRR
jgi:hypothetical protein